MGVERNVINAVHRQLSRDIHKESMTGGFKNGRPDYYYDAAIVAPKVRELWLEWKELKFLDDMWIRFDATILQKRWLERRAFNGANAFIMGGDGKGRFALGAPRSIEVLRPVGKDGKRFTMRSGYTTFKDAKEVARWIESFCFGKLGSGLA